MFHVNKFCREFVCFTVIKLKCLILYLKFVLLQGAFVSIMYCFCNGEVSYYCFLFINYYTEIKNTFCQFAISNSVKENVSPILSVDICT